MRRILILVLVAAFALSCVSVFAAKTSAKTTSTTKPIVKPAKPFDQAAEMKKFWSMPDSAVVGTVGNVKVTKGELVKTLWDWQAPSTLQELLSIKALELAAAKSNIKVNDKEIKEVIDKAVKQYGCATPQEFAQMQRLTWPRFQLLAKKNALYQKYVQSQIKVSDTEFAEYIMLRQIIITGPETETDQAKKDEEAKKKADAAYERLKAGEDFAKIADEFAPPSPDGAEVPKNGGMLGWITKGRIYPEAEKVAFGLKAGEYSEPIKTFFGYQIVKVEKLGKDANPAEREELRKVITESKTPMMMYQVGMQIQNLYKIDNKLMPPPPSPKPSGGSQPGKDANKTTKPQKPETKPVESNASEKPNTPPPPPSN